MRVNEKDYIEKEITSDIKDHWLIHYAHVIKVGNLRIPKRFEGKEIKLKIEVVGGKK